MAYTRLSISGTPGRNYSFSAKDPAGEGQSVIPIIMQYQAMMEEYMRPIKKGSTDQSCVIRIIDSTTGLPETAVEHDTAGIDLWYRREGETKTSITEAALASLDAAHSDGGIEHIGDGYYRLDLPDAAVAAGAGENGVAVGGTVTNMVVIGIYIPLVDYDPYDSVRMGVTALPNAAADAAGGLPISDAGGLDMDAILADTNELQADWANAGRLDTILDTIAADTTTDIPALIADVPTVAEFNARTLPSADYVVVTDTIAGCTTCTTNTDMRGTDSAALASVCTEGRLAELDAANLPTDVAGVKTDTAAILTDTNELQTDWANAGRLDTILDAIKTDTASTQAWGYINSGIVFRGVVTADDPGVSFTCAGLAGQGVGAFVDSETPWYAYVFRDAGGAAAAPQGEARRVLTYTSATGLFTTNAFSVAVATGDDVIIMNGRIGEIPDMAAEVDKIPKSDGAVTWNATALASINAEVDTALNTAIPASPTADSINAYIQAMKYVMINKMAVTEANGNTIIYKDNDSTEYCNVAAAYSSDATTTTRKRLE